MGKKKASLQLSVNAIVIIILAIVLLGLALVFVQDIFMKGTSPIIGIIDVSKLTVQPTPENPIVIADKLSLATNEEKILEIGFYCKTSTGCTDTQPFIERCTYSENGRESSGQTMPKFTSVKTTIGAGSSKGYKVVIEEKGLNGGLYICNLVFGQQPATPTAVYCKNNPAKCYDQKELFVEIG